MTGWSGGYVPPNLWDDKNIRLVSVEVVMIPASNARESVGNMNQLHHCFWSLVLLLMLQTVSGAVNLFSKSMINITHKINN